MPTEHRRPPGGPPARPFAERYPPGTAGWQDNPNAPVITPPRYLGPAERLPPAPPPEVAPGPGGAPLPTDTIGLLQAILLELQGSDQRGLVYSLTMTVQSPEAVPVAWDPPLFSLSLTCDGAGIVQYRLPNGGGSNWIDLRPNEQITFSLTKPRIVSAGFRVLGAAAVIRLVGLY